MIWCRYFIQTQCSVVPYSSRPLQGQGPRFKEKRGGAGGRKRKRRRRRRMREGVAYIKNEEKKEGEDDGGKTVWRNPSHGSYAFLSRISIYPQRRRVVVIARIDVGEKRGVGNDPFHFKSTRFSWRHTPWHSRAAIILR